MPKRGKSSGKCGFNDEDYLAFERVIAETLEKCPLRILGYTLMPNHWHFVLWPKNDQDLGRFMQRLTVTHVTRWQKNHNMVGFGHVYQGRFKSFPVENGEYFYRVVRYVERNALRANLVTRAEAWQWGSLWIRQFGSAEHHKLLSGWPLARPRKWLQYLGEPETKVELEALRQSCRRGTPYGSPDWVEKTVRQLNLESTIRPPGRPQKK